MLVEFVMLLAVPTVLKAQPTNVDKFLLHTMANISLNCVSTLGNNPIFKN
jgi:hypothetical protein